MKTVNEAGSAGGKKTLKKHGRKHFSTISKDAWSKRKKILEAFRVYELENPVTMKSVQDKLEQLDNADKN